MANGTYGYRVTGGQGAKIQIAGLKETQKALASMSDDLKDEMKSTHKKAAEVIVEGSKRYVPVRTGRLANSIRAVATRTSGRVRAGSAAVPYALHRQVDWRKVAWFGLPGMVGAWLGAKQPGKGVPGTPIVTR